jgi:gliding motility-associated transport system permease protein/gliding motility-associatede transport system auxiliary component
MKAHPVVRAIFVRDLKSWFSNPTGYVFITLFVFLCSFALFIPPRFFQMNSASLSPLSAWFGYLLLFFVPAVTMVVWAGERRQGTDEILLTLPASDGQIVLGKYLAAAGVYTLSLAFSFLVPIWVQFLGDPDWGLIVSTYLSYWLLGLFLIGAGMIGSQLTDNLTVAFILGALFCAAVVFSEHILGLLFPALWRDLFGYGPIEFFEELGRGVISIEAIVFFVGGTAAFLYMNLLLLSRRRWRSASNGLHLGIRAVCVVVGFLALTVLLGRWGPRMDFTAEGLHSLSDETKTILADLDPEHPVVVRAWVSPEVPRDFVPTRRALLDLLREYDSRGGAALRVEVVETERFSEEARDAESNFGIRHRTIYAEEGSRRREFDVHLGVALTCGAEEAVIPFLDKGLSVEYELTRSLRVVAGAARPKVGVLETDAKMFGGFDFQTFRRDPQWEIVRELQLQYDVEKVSPDEEYSADIDMLLVPMASSLTQPQMDRLATAVRGGMPTLILDDPFPYSNPTLAPSAPKGGQQNPMMRRGPPPEKKGDIAGFFRSFGIHWDPGAVAWDAYNPHPDIPSANEEWVFVGARSGGSAPFNEDEAITSGLQELLIWFGGAMRRSLEPGPASQLAFTPLLMTTRESGLLDQDSIFRRGPFGQTSINPNRPHRPSPEEHVLACRMRGAMGGGDAERAPATGPIDLIFVADIDVISLPFLWHFRREGNDEFTFDNVTFLLNCVDALAGETSFIELRKRRPKDRTLTTIEERETKFRDAWRAEKDEAEKAANAQLAGAQTRLDEAIKRIEELPGIDERAKEIQIESVRKVEQRRLDASTSTIEDEKQRRIDRAKGAMNKSIATIQNTYRFLAVGISPIPAILAGLFVYLMRRKRERVSVPATRSVEGGAR